MSRSIISTAHLVQQGLGAGAQPQSRCRSTFFARVMAQLMQLLAQMAVR